MSIETGSSCSSSCSSSSSSSSSRSSGFSCCTVDFGNACGVASRWSVAASARIAASPPAAQRRASQGGGRSPWRRSSLCLLMGLSLLSTLPNLSDAQGAPMLESQVPPGLRQWMGRDNCGGPRWVAFHSGLSEVINDFNRFDFQKALQGLSSMLLTVSLDPHVAFDCATAVGSALGLAALTSEQLQMPVLAARMRQLMAIFGSFDYQMKGEEYIDASPWPYKWMESMEGILRSMAMLKQYEVQADPLRARSAHELLQASSTTSRRSVTPKKIAIVSVCDYDAAFTPLERLSRINKRAYAEMHGYDVFVYEKAPIFEDPLRPLLVEPQSYRPAAWSKADAILLTLAQGKHDWVMWMDCDSFFMDPEVKLEDLAATAEAQQCGAEETASSDGQDLQGLQSLVESWMAGPSGDLAWFEDLLADTLETPDALSGCGGPYEMAGAPPENRTLGFAKWLYQQRRPMILASEDGLMLNTGIVLVRASPWSWGFFQHVRWMTFGRSPVTQHPWWEQTAMVYLLQMPFTLTHAAAAAASATAPSDIGLASGHLGYTPACFMLSQKHINGYPPAVAQALKTHETFAPGDFIVSFSGCKVYSSQEVCNDLFFSYFFQVHDFKDFESDPVLQSWM